MHTTKTHVKNPSDTSDEPQNSQRFSGKWETKQLGEISDVNPQNFSSNTNPNYKFNYITLEQVDSGKLLGYSEEVFRTAPSRAQRILQNGDVLMSTVRPNLMAHLFFDGQVPNAVCSTGFAVLRAKHDSSVPYFLFSQLFSEGVNDQIDKILSGSNYPAINSQDVKLIKIPCPPQVSEQRAIAEVLSDIDGLINALEALIAKKQAIKQAAMQQLLTGRTRLPGFSEAWKTKRIGDLLSYKRPDAYIVKSTEYSEHGNIPVLTANKAFILGYTDEVFGICQNYPAIVFDDFTTDNKYATFPFKVKSSAIKLLYPKHERVSLKYVFERIQLIDFPLGNHKRYYISEYQNLELCVPDYEEQCAIAAVLSDMDAEITALEQRRDKTVAIKQGMMQQLLTGKVRLSESRICTDDTD